MTMRVSLLSIIALAVLGCSVGTSTGTATQAPDGDGRLLSLEGADYIGTACSGGQGTCLDERFDGCNSGYRTGLCDGPSNIRCCLDSEPAGLEVLDISDAVGAACGGLGEGVCLDERVDACTTGFVTGLCDGPAVVRCCFDEALNGTSPAESYPEAEPEPAARPEARGRAISSSPSGVPYFYQYANRINPGATCQNTSIAMVLASLGWTGRPDDITQEFGRRLAQTPGGLSGLFNQLAARSGIGGRLTPRTSASVDDLRRALRKGPAIVHGYFTRSGHVLVVLSYGPGGYVVHDPAGRWDGVFRGGYGNNGGATGGRRVTYPKAAFERAISTSNGYDYLPIWMHELNP